MADKKSIYTIYDDHKSGTVQISESVLAVIAAIAATDIEGVASIKGDLDRKQISRSDIRAISRSAKVVLSENRMKVQLVLNIKYGYSIPDVSIAVQEKVKDNLENMTGFKVESVHVSIADVQMDSKKEKKEKKTRK